MSEPLACGTRRQPECEPVNPGAPLSPDDFGIPRSRCFSPGEVAGYLRVSVKTILREIEAGTLRAMPVGASYRIPYIEIAQWFLRRQGAFN